MDQGWVTFFLLWAVLIVILRSQAAGSEGITGFSHEAQAMGPKQALLGENTRGSGVRTNL